MSETVQLLPDMQRRVLLALARFRFLTPAQMVRLGLSQSIDSLRKNALNPLKRARKPLAKAQKLGSFLPEVHYLTQYGAEELAAQYRQPIEDFPYPTGQVQFGALFARHRFAQIDFHIGLSQWAHDWGDVEILFADMDFDVTGSRRTGDFQPRTRLCLPDWTTPVIADGIFGVQFPADQHPIIYILEVHRATESTRIARQIARYIEIIQAREIMAKYRLNVSPAICSVHTRQRTLTGAKTRLLNLPEFQPFRAAFIFNTTDQLAENFSQGWHFADDQPAYPFPQPNEINTESLFV